MSTQYSISSRISVVLFWSGSSILLIRVAVCLGGISALSESDKIPRISVFIYWNNPVMATSTYSAAFRLDLNSARSIRHARIIVKSIPAKFIHHLPYMKTYLASILIGLGIGMCDSQVCTIKLQHWKHRPHIRFVADESSTCCWREQTTDRDSERGCGAGGTVLG